MKERKIRPEMLTGYGSKDAVIQNFLDAGFWTKCTREKNRLTVWITWCFRSAGATVRRKRERKWR